MKYARSARPVEPVAEERGDLYTYGGNDLPSTEGGYRYDQDAQPEYQETDEGYARYDDGYASYDEGYEGYDDEAYADDQQWEPSYDEEAVYEDDQPQNHENGSAAAYDDSRFRRPVQDQEPQRPASRRSRRYRSDVDA